MNAAGKPAIDQQHRVAEDVAVEHAALVRPLARAVSTYCLLISSRKQFLVSIVSVAKPPITSAVIGRAMCQK